MCWRGIVVVVVVVVALASGAVRADEPGSELPPPSPELVAPLPQPTAAPSLHPAVYIMDAEITPVRDSGGLASAERSCDGCHDVDWIKAHDGHATARMPAGTDPVRLVANNCFVCHAGLADHQARRRVIDQGKAGEADTATLAGTALVSLEGERWVWKKSAFKEDGSIAPEALGLARPTPRACGTCHAQVHAGQTPLALARDPHQRMTDLQGFVFSGQRISDSAVNIAGKAALTRPWDVHAERLVSCAGCHFSPNHPAYSFSNTGPEHLAFDARRVAITEFLWRPDHRLANRADGTIRRCESCHDALEVHGFLPRADRHFGALACESCHVPRVHAPARQETDFTMLTAERQPRVVYRGVRDDGFVLGFRPVLLSRLQADGSHKFSPNTVATTYRWIDRAAGKPETVPTEVLVRAFFAGDAHRPELVRALDRNGNGALEADELVLDTEAKVQAARALLVAAGVRAPEMVGEVAAYELHHGVSPGRFATRTCESCHASESRFGASFVAASVVPFGVTPAFTGKLDAALVRDGNGRLVLEPGPGAVHVFGHTRSRWVDGLGMLMVAGAFAGALTHGLLRWRGARRRRFDQSGGGREERT